jgi:hypothetical protein
MNSHPFQGAWSGLLAMIILTHGALSAWAQDTPTITTQPRPQSVSLGANVTFRVNAGPLPLDYQWRFNDATLPGATNTTLGLTNVALPAAGAYSVVVANPSGAVTSQVATLQIDPSFIKITTGLIATEGGDASGAAWGDFDNDGWADLFAGNGSTRNFLYRNNGDGTFTKLTNAVPARDNGFGGSWGDYDNDGWLDLFVGNSAANYLYRNNRDGTFTKVLPFAATGGTISWSGSWADYDRDGWLDLYIANGANNNDFLLHNNRNGSFSKITSGAIVRDLGTSIGAAWQDYDNDGWPDLFVANNGGKNFLYHNLGDGTFERVLSGRVATDTQASIVPDWGDYDNDGWPDLAVGSFGRNLLYRNLGNGVFEKQTNGPVATDSLNSEIVHWVDYDNDGFLDLFSANAANQNNTLYHNNGDGTFAKITTGSVVNDGGNSAGGAWGDYDNDGFLDLFVANWQGSRPNFFYRNAGNTNHWLKVRCVGTTSNRGGIGAKVRATADFRGADRRQLREISGGSGFGQTTPLAHFGLAEATNVPLLRIEWPSGIVQELRNVPVNQMLTVTEPVRFGEPRGAAGGAIRFAFHGTPGNRYQLQTSTNLVQWEAWPAAPDGNDQGEFGFTVKPAEGSAGRFFRAVAP